MNNWTIKDALVGIVTGIATTAAFGLIGGMEISDPTPTPTPNLFGSIFNDPSTTPCVYEDGSELLDEANADDPKLKTITPRACKWDAGSVGNRRGQSFVVLAVPDPRGPGVRLLYLYDDNHYEW